MMKGIRIAIGIAFLFLISLTLFYFQRMSLASGLGENQVEGFRAVSSYEAISPFATMCGLLFILTLPKRFSFIVFAVSASILSLTLLLNYIGNVANMGSIPGWNQIMVALFNTSDHTLNDIAAAFLLPIGIRIASFTNALYWFGFLVLSFLRIRADFKPFKVAVTDTLIMGSCVLGLFAAGICLIDPFWTFQPITTHWQDGTALQFFTNFDLLITSGVAGSVLVLIRRTRL